MKSKGNNGGKWEDLEGKNECKLSMMKLVMEMGMVESGAFPKWGFEL